MTTQYKRRLMKKVLTQIPLYRSSIEYYAQLATLPALSVRKSRAAEVRLLAMTGLIQSVENALPLLGDIEREIIELHYIHKHPFDEIQEMVHLERSSVYRYHNKAVDKLATAVYGD